MRGPQVAANIFVKILENRCAPTFLPKNPKTRGIPKKLSMHSLKNSEGLSGSRQHFRQESRKQVCAHIFAENSKNMWATITLFFATPHFSRNWAAAVLCVICCLFSPPRQT